MSDEPTQERRQSQRATVAVTVQLLSDSGFSLHATRNLSAGGAFFDRTIPYPIGSQVQAVLHLPGEEPIHCLGEVVNVPAPKSFGMGVRFTALSDAARARLSAFTEARRA